MKQVVFNSWFLLTVFSIFSGVWGCAPPLSPPVRGLMYGSPARFEKGDVEWGAGVGSLFGTKAGYAPLDWLQVEGGVEAMGGVMLFGGTRLSFWPVTKQHGRFKLLSEIELGGGVGAGGMNCDSEAVDETCDGFESEGNWDDRVAYGGYTGTGLGWGIGEWIDLYAKTRVQVTKSQDVPVTFWASGATGIQVNVFKTVKIYFSPIQIHYYTNRFDHARMYTMEIGLGFTDNMIHHDPFMIEARRENESSK